MMKIWLYCDGRQSISGCMYVSTKSLKNVWFQLPEVCMFKLGCRTHSCHYNNKLKKSVKGNYQYI